MIMGPLTYQPIGVMCRTSFDIIDYIEHTLDDKECLIPMGGRKTYIGWIHKAHKPSHNDHPQLTLRKNETLKTTGRPAH